MPYMIILKEFMNQHFPFSDTLPQAVAIFTMVSSTVLTVLTISVTVCDMVVNKLYFKVRILLKCIFVMPRTTARGFILNKVE